MRLNQPRAHNHAHPVSLALSPPALPTTITTITTAAAPQHHTNPCIPPPPSSPHIQQPPTLHDTLLSCATSSCTRPCSLYTASFSACTSSTACAR